MPSSLDRRQAIQPAKDRMLLLAPPSATTYLQNLIDYLDLVSPITLASLKLATADELLTLAKHHHLQSGPFRRIFAVLDLPVGESAFKNMYKVSRDIVRHHDIIGNVLFRVLFSRPDFSLWPSLHAPFPQAPIDSPEYSAWLQQLFQQSTAPSLSHETAHSLDTAIKQAQSLARIRALNPTDYTLSFTEIHELIAYLLRMSQRIHHR